MKSKLLAAALAASILPACSSEANSLEDKSPEEIAAYILFGMEEDQWEVTGGTMMMAVRNAKPLHMVLAAQNKAARFDLVETAVNMSDGCRFTTTVKDTTRSPDFKRGTFAVDFSGLSAVRLDTVSNGKVFAYLDGAKIQCVDSDEGFCEFFNADTAVTGEWRWRYDFREHETESRQAQMDETVTYFKANICKPST
ncbi:hypothetical protein SAMN05892877_14122 [Rhizobium subbaraonis]|uniref:Lipoprotein n=1 Tax=Rhizobium subbaraonis TaxID=908946 RepID=A0A285V3J3_9HYPH|nr:hypothetical protein [Rhizobium subbaraonis]SOC48178.1 hypothetical protein SAMN05892877_14122 [Rhizobium subbaraonis]